MYTNLVIMTESNENINMNISNNNDNDNDNNNIGVKEEIKQNASQELDINKKVTTNLGLLVNLKRMVDICVSRGAFKSEELSQIGSVIDILNSTLKENIE